MKEISLIAVAFFLFAFAGNAQDLKTKDVPAMVKSAFQKEYPRAKKVSWEKENGNYEANWGGKSGEDNSVQFTPDGAFVEMVKDMPVTALPKSIVDYVRQHYNSAKITEAGKVKDAQGRLSYAVEVCGKDIIFDQDGNFVRHE